MRVEAVSGAREPSNRDVLKRWWKWANESKEGRLISWIITLLFLLFFATNVVKADVYAYSSAADCDADRDTNPKARYVAIYEDEWALIADTISNYTFYSLGGDKCFRVTGAHREILNGEIRIVGTRMTISATGIAVIVGPARAALIAIGNWIGWPLIADKPALEAAVEFRNDNVLSRLRDPCVALITDLTIGGAIGGATVPVDYSGLYSDCIKKVPPSTGPANRVEIPRPGARSAPCGADRPHAWRALPLPQHSWRGLALLVHFDGQW